MYALFLVSFLFFYALFLHDGIKSIFHKMQIALFAKKGLLFVYLNQM